MTSTAFTLLSTLHKELSALNGFMIVAPKYASYPLMTYTILNSRPTRVKSFTSDGDIYSVQFSYFSDASLLSCMNIATSAEAKLESLSAFFDIDNGNLTTIGSTENGTFYQIVDTRSIEILEDLTPVIPVPPAPSGIEYTFTGAIDGDFAISGNYTPLGIPTSIDNVYFNETVTNMPSTGSLTCSTLTVENNGTSLEAFETLLGSECIVNGIVEFNGIFIEPNPFTCINLGNISIGIFNSYSNNGGTVTDGIFNGNSINSGTIVNIGSFNNTSDNQGSCYEANFIPELVEGNWIYPTNSFGTGETANCYWDQIDNELGIGFNTVNYLGYPN